MSTLNIEINGVVDTGVDVLTNINRIADAALCYVSWDLSVGKWSVIIKEPDSSVASFDDSNIVGTITVSGSGLRESYNSATIRFPHKDLDSESDYVTVSVSQGDRYPNELDNELQMSTALVNDPVHAQYMASIELANSRLDQIIQFSTDFSQLGVTAGDLIAVTNSVYGFSNKLFRVQRVSERDNTDGTLLIDIVAQEYEDIYSQPLARTDASRTGGIMPYEACEELQAADDAAATPPMDPDCKCLIASYAAPEFVITPYTNNYSLTDRQFFAWEFFNDILGINVLEIGFDPNASAHRYETGIVHTAKKAGLYLIYACHYLSWSQPNFASGDRVWQPENDPTKPRFLTQAHYKLNGVYKKTGFVRAVITGTDVGNFTTTFGSYVINLQENDTLEFIIRTKTDFGPNHPEMDPNTNVGIASSYEVFYIS